MCNCNLTTQPYHQTACSLWAGLSGLTFVTDGSNLIPYINGIPQEPIDLTDVIQEGESNTRLQLDISQPALVYTSERALSEGSAEDSILLETVSKLIPLSGLKDVSYNGVSGGDVLVFNIQTQMWEPVSVNEDDLVTVVGYNSAGRLSKADASDFGGGGGGGGERPTFTTATAVSVVPDSLTYSQYSYTALATAIVIGSPGVVADGKTLIFRFRDNGTARALNWNGIYRGLGVTIPTATVANKVVYVGAKYHAADNKWDVLAVNRQP